MIELNPEFEDNLDKFCMNHKPLVFAFLLAFFGMIIPKIGLDFFNNRYIVIPYILLVVIGYLAMKREQHHG